MQQTEKQNRNSVATWHGKLKVRFVLESEGRNHTAMKTAQIQQCRYQLPEKNSGKTNLTEKQRQPKAVEAVPYVIADRPLVEADLPSSTHRLECMIGFVQSCIDWANSTRHLIQERQMTSRQSVRVNRSIECCKKAAR